MDRFYVIKVINKDNTRGYVMDTPKGIIIIKNGIDAGVTMFQTYQDAQQFIRDRKIERKGVRAYIRDNDDLMKDEKVNFVTADKPIYSIENHKGERLVYESARNVYFFKKCGEVGFCIWYEEDEVRKFVDHYKFQQAQIYMIKQLKSEIQSKTLIQLYGSKKREDGTLEEPEHININENAITNDN